jgi:hypothetical protein
LLEEQISLQYYRQPPINIRQHRAHGTTAAQGCVGESPSWLRHWILIPACEGSNPSSPAIELVSRDLLEVVCNNPLEAVAKLSWLGVPTQTGRLYGKEAQQRQVNFATASYHLIRTSKKTSRQRKTASVTHCRLFDFLTIAFRELHGARKPDGFYRQR